VKFLVHYPNGFWLYTVLFIGYLVASFFLGLISYPFTLVPIIGAFFSFPFMSYLFQTYLGLVIIAIIFSYYYAKEFGEEPVQPVVETPLAETQERARPTAAAPPRTPPQSPGSSRDACVSPSIRPVCRTPTR